MPLGYHRFVEGEKEPTRREKKKRLREEKKKAKEKNTLVKRLSVVALLTIIAVGGGFLFSRSQSNSDNSNSKIEQVSQVANISERDHAKGALDSQIVLIEYGDFQCPACGTYHPVVKQLESQFGSQVKFIYRHMPLKSIHGNAEIAAIASEAANSQGKFWEMHDKLFENQTDWSNLRDPKDKFTEYANELGLETDKFISDLDSQELKSIVNADLDQAISFGVNSTPTFFVNDKKLNNPSPNDITEAIQKALAPQQ